ncbi:MAG: zinc ribbon domain-containing protein [Methanobacteriota archaeon]|nr:MAG: zinc ribbon domain-containing protein [Euryarchaeota archaeon]
MKCPVCQIEVPNEEEHCAYCGAELPRPEQAPEEQPIVAISTIQKKPWLLTHRKVLAAAATILIVVLASIGIIYTQPLSKIKILVAHDQQSAMLVGVYIDDVHKAFVLVDTGGWKIAGVWSVTAGSHSVILVSDAEAVIDPFDSPPIWHSFIYEVGPLYTKDVYIQL